MFAFTKPPWISTLHTRLFYNNKLAPNCYNHTHCVLQQLVFFYFLVKIISRNWWAWVLCKSRQVPDINELILTLKEYTYTREVFSLLNIRCSAVISHLYCLSSAFIPICPSRDWIPGLILANGQTQSKNSLALTSLAHGTQQGSWDGPPLSERPKGGGKGQLYLFYKMDNECTQH